MAPWYPVKDTMPDVSYFNISEINLSITSLFSVQIMSHLGVSDMIYSNVIDSFFSEIVRYESSVIVLKMLRKVYSSLPTAF